MGRKQRESNGCALTLGERLGDLVSARKEKEKIKQNDIAAALGVSISTLSDWINNKKTISIDNLVKVARYFGVSADYLLGLSSEQSPDQSMQGACMLTGLSGSAIKRLHFFCNLKDYETIEFINNLIKNSYFVTAIQNFNLAKSFENSCNARDAYKKGLKDSLKKTGMNQEEQIVFLKDFHALYDYSIMDEHRADKIELSPDDMEKFYFIVARDYFLKAIDYIWEGGEGYGLD